MENLLAARTQMALSLVFHIVFASIGVALPFLMSLAHFRWLQTKKEEYLLLTKAWMKGFAILFATGAVSGTVLSFELGLLWPVFMEFAGSIIGMPFSWEGAAFFLEAIALGLYLYGWNRMPERLHWMLTLVIGFSGIASAMFVICANGWMNAPTGFTWTPSGPIDVDPVAAMFNEAALGQGIHMVIASFVATGLAVAGVHSFYLLRSPKTWIHEKAIRMAMIFVVLGSIVQPLSGDLLAKDLAHRQPEKFAAMEGLFRTQRQAPLLIGGIPDQKSETISFGLHLPKLLSILTHGDANAEVKGLDAFPKENWPNVKITHLSFQMMVGLGMIFLFLSLSYVWMHWIRKRDISGRSIFLGFMVTLTPMGFLAIEAGWFVTEVGRQPWIIYQIMKTRDAVTPMPGIIVPMILFTGLYLLLSVVVGWMLLRHFQHFHRSVEKI